MELEYPNCCIIAWPYKLSYVRPDDSLNVIHSLKEDYGFTDKEIALIINVTVASLEEFFKLNEVPNEEERRHIIMMRDIIKLDLHISLNHKKITRWFRGRANYLDGESPLRVLKGGIFRRNNVLKVIQAANVYKDGIRGQPGTRPLRYKAWFYR